jgi:hypothetical protein
MSREWQNVYLNKISQEINMQKKPYKKFQNVNINETEKLRTLSIKLVKILAKCCI